ncbi:TPA: Crp/Fnr family transcriptional regulator [Escherichia coli]|nr:Crp/Fnr family transcriptional regulator [Escherichia coli]HBA8153101.1 Crp/Fnr family transcriptional regulator [Escherichia coli]
MNSLKNQKPLDDWRIALGLIVKELQLYELVKYCPIDIMLSWRIEEIPCGAFICRQGDICQKFSLIVSGEVDVFYEVEDGRCYQQARYYKGDMLGELEIFDSRNYICSVKAVSNVQLLTLQNADFNRWLEVDNHFNQQMLRFFSRQYYQLSKKASRDNLYSLCQRVCHTLWQQYQRNRDTKIFLDKQNLSQELAATMRSINRILHNLKLLKIIDYDGERIILLEPEKLKQKLEK